MRDYYSIRKYNNFVHNFIHNQIARRVREEYMGL